MSLTHRRRYAVIANGSARFLPNRFDAVLPHVEWAVGWEIPQTLPEYLHLHASVLERDGKAVVFPGPPGCGKSTLAVGLVATGWRYLCDEFALVHTQTLRVHPYPRAICVKEGAFSALKQLGIEIAQDRVFCKGAKGRVILLRPLDIRPDAVGRAGEVAAVIFPSYTPGAEPSLIPIRRAEAAFALHAVCFNLLGCRAVGLDVIVGLIRKASCFRLVSGDLRRTCEMIDSALAHA